MAAANIQDVKDAGYGTGKTDDEISFQLGKALRSIESRGVPQSDVRFSDAQICFVGSGLGFSRGAASEGVQDVNISYAGTSNQSLMDECNDIIAEILGPVARFSAC